MVPRIHFQNFSKIFTSVRLINQIMIYIYTAMYPFVLKFGTGSDNCIRGDISWDNA